MKTPNASEAVVPEEKLLGYLLSTTHPIGAAKARFFRAHGFDESNVELLERALLALVRNEEATSSEKSEYGNKYIVEGNLESPRGGSVKVRTVWISERDEDPPRFVTAYPV